MTESTIPRCDYVPFLTSSTHRCDRPAVLRVVRSHGAGIDPVYRDRCLRHCTGDLGPRIVGFWDSEALVWQATD